MSGASVGIVLHRGAFFIFVRDDKGVQMAITMPPDYVTSVIGTARTPSSYSDARGY